VRLTPAARPSCNSEELDRARWHPAATSGIFGGARPAFRESIAAVIISAQSPIGNDEVKQLVKRKK
jgi:hypothetical protein